MGEEKAYVRSIAKALQRRHGIMNALLRMPETARRLGEDPELLLEILSQDDHWHKLISALTPDSVGPGHAIDVSAGDLQRLLAALDPSALHKAAEGFDAETLAPLLTAAEGFNAEMLTPLLLATEGIDAETLTQWLPALDQDSLVRAVRRWCLKDAAFFDDLLGRIEDTHLADHLGVRRLAELLRNHCVADSKRAPAADQEAATPLAEFVQRFGEQRLAGAISQRKLLEQCSLEEYVARDGVNRVVRELGIEEVATSTHIGAIVRAAGAELVIESLGMPKLLEALAPDNPDLLAHVSTSARSVAKLMADDEVMKHVLRDFPLRERLRCLDRQLVAEAYPYVLPSAVVSFPRSGSNFLQSVLMHTSGLHNLSIYGPLPDGKENTLSVKSHALSPDYLVDEYDRLLDGALRPTHIVLIQRDPRDVMISFLEYTQATRGLELDQEDFLDLDFFYASRIDKGQGRRLELGPLSVKEAYQKHVAAWFAERPADLEVLVVRYEDLVGSPAQEFGKVLAHLQVSAPLLAEALELRVSQYSHEGRRRGTARGWAEALDRYGALIEAVEAELRDEMTLLGYEARPGGVGESDTVSPEETP